MGEVESSIEKWNNPSFQKNKECLFKDIKSNKETSVFFKKHIDNY